MARERVGERGEERGEGEGGRGRGGEDRGVRSVWSGREGC